MDDVAWRKALTEKYDLTEEQGLKLQTYVELLRKWQKKINLVSNTTIKHAWERHIEDSLQLVPIIKENAGDKRLKMMDMGCGAGFPGLVLAVLDIADISLVESDMRKCLFMKEVARQTETTVDVVNKRIEKAELSDMDLVSARALAALDMLCDYAHPFLNDEGKCLFLKGEKADQEVSEARKKWQFDVKTYPSVTSNVAQILLLSNLKPC